MQHLRRFAPAAAFWLLALAATVSGFTNPYIAAVLAAIGVLLLIWPVWGWVRDRRAAASGDQKIPLHDGLLLLWESMRQLPKYAPYVADYEGRPERMMRMLAQMTFKMSTPPTLYGVHPPRSAVDIVPTDHIEGWDFSDDARTLADKYWGGGHYEQLQVKRSDIEALTKAMIE